MPDFSATEVAFTGFRFVREHPRTAAAWAAVQLVISGILGAVLTALAGPALTQLQAQGMQGSRDPAQALALLHQLLPVYLLLIPFALIFYPVLYAAMSREVLRPGEGRWGYLRLGMDEVRQLLLFLFMIVVGFVAEIVGLIAAIIPAVIVTLVAKGLAPLIHLIIFLTLFCAVIYVWVRLSLAWSLTFDRQRVSMFGSWALTRGHFWKMFGTYVLVLALAVVVCLLVALIGVALAAITGGGLGGISLLIRPDMSSMGAYFSPVRLVMLVVSSVAAALVWPLLLMPQAAIYAALRPNSSSL